MQRDETTVGFQEEEESSDKANALSNNSDPLPLQAESAGKSMEDIMLAARPVEGEDVVHMGSPPDLLAMAAQHGSQDASHLEIKSQLISRLVHGDLGEHAGIPSMEQVASVADQAAKMNMRKLGSSAQLNRDEQYYVELEESAMIES